MLKGANLSSKWDQFEEVKPASKWDQFEEVEAEASAPVQREPARAPDVPTYTDSAVMGAAKGVSAGWLPEFSGSIEALGSAVGIRGLGGPFKDVEFGGDDRTMGEAYDEGRDRKRQLLAEAEQANPKMFLGGEIPGMIASPVGKIAQGAATAAKAGPLAARVAGIVGGGAAFGAGYGDRENLAGDAAKGAAVEAGTDLAVSTILPPAARALRRGALKAGELITDVPEEVVNKYIARGRPKPKESLADIATDFNARMVDGRESLSRQSSQAYDILEEAPDLAPGVASKFAGDAAHEIDVGGTFAKADRRALSEMDELASALNTGAPIPGGQIKSLLGRLDANIERLRKQGATSTTEYRALSGLRQRLSNKMGEISPKYAEHMKGLAKETEAHKALARRTGTQRATENLFREVQRGGNRDMSKAIQALDETRGTRFSDRVIDRGIADQFEKSRKNGSRAVMAGAAMGGTGGPIGAATGAAGGFLRDKWGGRIYRGLIDGTVTLGKFTQPLRQIINTHGHRAGQVYFQQLMQRDPEFKAEVEREATNQSFLRGNNAKTTEAADEGRKQAPDDPWADLDDDREVVLPIPVG